MQRESDSFAVGDRVRPFKFPVHSLGREQRITTYGPYTIAGIRREDEGRDLFLRFQETEGEYLAHQFAREPSRPTRISVGHLFSCPSTSFGVW